MTSFAGSNGRPFLIAVASVFLGSTAAAAPISTLVMDLDSKTVSKDQLTTLSEELRSELAKFPSLSVISQADIVRIIGVEQQRQLAGCDTSSCMTELAGALGAARLVAGSIGAVGEQQLIQLQLIDAQKAIVLRRASHPAGGTSLVDAVRAVARKLMAVAATLHLINQVDGAEVFVADNLVGVMPLKPFAVHESGDVELRIEHVDYVPYEDAVTLTPGQTTRHILRMNRYQDLESSAANRRYASYGLLGGAAVTYGASVLFFLHSKEAYDSYERLDARRASADQFDAYEDRARSRLLLAELGAGVGTVLLATGLYLWAVNPAAEQLQHVQGTPAVGAAALPGGFAAVLTAGF